MLSIKPNVRITNLSPQMVLAAFVWYDACIDVGVLDATITSGNDSTHSADSLHYIGHALDFRIRDIPEAILPKIIARVKEALGPDFDVVEEGNHVHIEYQPKNAGII